MTEKAIKIAIASLALGTSTGVLLHDTHFDQMIIGVIAANSTDSKNLEISAKSHTHSEEIKIKRAESLRKQPTTDPRDKIKKSKRKNSDRKNKFSMHSLFRFA